MNHCKYEYDSWGRVCTKCKVKKRWCEFHSRKGLTIIKRHTSMCGPCIQERRIERLKERGLIDSKTGRDKRKPDDIPPRQFIIDPKKVKSAAFKQFIKPPTLEMCPDDYYKELAECE